MRDQGYTDSPRLIRAPIVREALDDRDEEVVLRERHGSLAARSVGARLTGDAWEVLFAYSRSAMRAGRAVRVHPPDSDGRVSIEVVHQDAVLPDHRPERVELVARFRGFLSADQPGCGEMHFALVARYDVVRVLDGAYEGTPLLAIHGCPELARSDYRTNAGTLTQFREGDLHRLVIVPHTPDVEGGLALLDEPVDPGLHRYWVERVDPFTE